MRKPIALLLIGFVATALHAENKFDILTTPGRLPKDVVPRSYLIDLEPNIETLVTDGFESIEIEILKPTDHIVLNAVDSEISAAKIAIGDREEELTPQFDSDQQTVSFASHEDFGARAIHSVVQVSKQDWRTAARPIHPAFRLPRRPATSSGDRIRARRCKTRVSLLG